MTELSSPHVRAQLIDYLIGLSDREYQLKSWQVFDHVNNRYDEFGYTVHFLYDDTYLADNPELAIGDSLYDREEVETVTAITTALEKVFDKHGLNLSDAAYIATPEWNEVIETAKTALAILGSCKQIL